ncbi:hypothetical protein LPJ53_005972 [Coemansia erecta]|uniref:Uncharacterized protein n=1 Tax=Coemansia erecta TaxID=147472 RepID=A0A9W7XVK3_9FUNG|nr:hypothetical protein LPJ53_005972 [Coemansia erecta]
MLNSWNGFKSDVVGHSDKTTKSRVCCKCLGPLFAMSHLYSTMDLTSGYTKSMVHYQSPCHNSCKSVLGSKLVAVVVSIFNYNSAWAWFVDQSGMAPPEFKTSKPSEKDFSWWLGDDYTKDKLGINLYPLAYLFIKHLCGED